MALESSQTLEEFARIVRGEHPGWKGDRRHNGGVFLYERRREDPVAAKALAFALECKMGAFSEATGLPLRTLEQAQRVLDGRTCEL